MNDNQFCIWFKRYTGYEVDQIFVSEFRRWLLRRATNGDFSKQRVDKKQAWIKKHMQQYMAMPGIL